MRFAGLPVSMACLVSLAGCGASDWGTATGTVRYQGKVLTNGMVTFHPTEHGAAAYGTIHKDGTFTMMTGARQGLKPGTYKITVVSQTLPKMDPKEIAKLLTPAKYGWPTTTDLSVTIKAGANSADMTLKNW